LINPMAEADGVRALPGSEVGTPRNPLVLPSI